MTETEIPTPETQEVLEPTIEDMIQAEDGVPFTTSGIRQGAQGCLKGHFQYGMFP